MGRVLDERLLTGRWDEDGIIILEKNVSSQVLTKYGIPLPPAKVDFSRYLLAKTIYAGRVSFPALIEKEELKETKNL